MQAFIRVIEIGSFSAAARDLEMGQPAVSKTIAQLEDRLGVQLVLPLVERSAALREFAARLADNLDVSEGVLK